MAVTYDYTLIPSPALQMFYNAEKLAMFPQIRELTILHPLNNETCMANIVEFTQW